MQPNNCCACSRGAHSTIDARWQISNSSTTTLHTHTFIRYALVESLYVVNLNLTEKFLFPLFGFVFLLFFLFVYLLNCCCCFGVFCHSLLDAMLVCVVPSCLPKSTPNQPIHFILYFSLNARKRIDQIGQIGTSFSIQLFPFHFSFSSLPLCIFTCLYTQFFFFRLFATTATAAVAG